MELDKLKKIQIAYRNAKQIRQNGDENVIVNPFYISIHNNNRVREFKDLSLCLSSNPKFVIGITTIFSRGNNGYQRIDTLPQIFGFITSSSTILPEIELDNWTLSDIELHCIEPTIINKAKLTSNSDYTKEYILDYRNDPSPFRSFQTLWNLVVQIDTQCQTVNDVKNYSDDYIKKLIES